LIFMSRKKKLEFEIDWSRASEEFLATYFQLLFYYLRDMEGVEEEDALLTTIAFFEEKGINVEEKLEMWAKLGLIRIPFKRYTKYIG